MLDAVVLILLGAALVALLATWAKVRALEQRAGDVAKSAAEVERLVKSECLPAVTESARRVTTVLDRLDAERAAAEAEVARSRDGLAPILEELRRAATQLGEARVELARIVDRGGAPKPQEESAKTGDGPWLRDLVRTHLLGMGVGAITIDGVVSKADGSHVARARGLRGAELWTGNVVVKGGKVESASALAVRMFP